MANNYFKKCSTSLEDTKSKLQIIMRYHFLSTKLQKFENQEYWISVVSTTGFKYELVQTLWERV